MNSFVSDWPAYVMIAAVVGFFVFAIVKSKQEEKQNKKTQNNEKGQK